MPLDILVTLNAEVSKVSMLKMPHDLIDLVFICKQRTSFDICLIVIQWDYALSVLSGNE